MSIAEETRRPDVYKDVQPAKAQGTANLIGMAGGALHAASRGVSPMYGAFTNPVTGAAMFANPKARLAQAKADRAYLGHSKSAPNMTSRTADYAAGMPSLKKKAEAEAPWYTHPAVGAVGAGAGGGLGAHLARRARRRTEPEPASLKQSSDRRLRAQAESVGLTLLQKTSITRAEAALLVGVPAGVAGGLTMRRDAHGELRSPARVAGNAAVYGSLPLAALAAAVSGPDLGSTLKFVGRASREAAPVALPVAAGAAAIQHWRRRAEKTSAYARKGILGGQGLPPDVVRALQQDPSLRHTTDNMRGGELVGRTTYGLDVEATEAEREFRAKSDGLMGALMGAVAGTVAAAPLARRPLPALLLGGGLGVAGGALAGRAYGARRAAPILNAEYQNLDPDFETYAAQKASAVQLPLFPRNAGQRVLDGLRSVASPEAVGRQLGRIPPAVLAAPALVGSFAAMEAGTRGASRAWGRLREDARYRAAMDGMNPGDFGDPSFEYRYQEDPAAMDKSLRQAFGIINQYAPKVAKDPVLAREFMRRMQLDPTYRQPPEQYLSQVRELVALENAMQSAQPSMMDGFGGIAASTLKGA